MPLPRLARAALLIVALAGSLPAAARAVDPKLLPKNTEVIVTVNLQQILSSEVAKENKELVDQAKFFIENNLADKGIAKHLEKAGFDLFRDLQSGTFASPGNSKPEEGLLVLEGKFDAAKIRTAAEDAAKDAGGTLKVTKSGLNQVFEVTPQGEKTLLVTILNNKTLIAAGDRAVLGAALGRLESGESADMNKSFKAVMTTTSPKQSFSIVATGQAMARLLENAPIPNAETAAASLQQVDGMSFAFTAQRDITFQIGVNAKDKGAAEQMAQALNGGLKLAQGFVSKKAKEDEKFVPALDVVKTLRVQSQASNVTIRGEITFENLGKMLKNLPSRN